MTMTAPTRITIEVHPGDATLGSAGAPFVRVLPELPATHAHVASDATANDPAPAAYDPGECLCLDDADCGADHAND